MQAFGGKVYKKQDGKVAVGILKKIHCHLTYFFLMPL